MEFSAYFPIWNKLADPQRRRLQESAVFRQVPKGTVIHNGSVNCTGLLLVGSGQLRAYSLSEEGREITLYRLFERDICLFSASCMLNSLQFEVTIQAEKDAAFWVIPAEVYKKLMEEDPAAANYTNEVMAARFSEVMWLMEQLMWKSLDKRLAAFLLSEAALENTPRLHITHEMIGSHLGTAREVNTRMLRYYHSEGLVRLSRGTVELLDERRLSALAAG